MKEEEKPKASVEMQRLVNDLVANASHLYSEFPVKQMRCKQQAEKLHEELLDRIARLEKAAK